MTGKVAARSEVYGAITGLHLADITRAYHSASCVFIFQLVLHLARVGVVGALVLVAWQADHLFGL